MAVRQKRPIRILKNRSILIIVKRNNHPMHNKINYIQYLKKQNVVPHLLDGEERLLVTSSNLETKNKYSKLTDTMLIARIYRKLREVTVNHMCLSLLWSIEDRYDGLYLYFFAHNVASNYWLLGFVREIR